MAKSVQYRDTKFTLDDTQGCYVMVTMDGYDDRVGFVGVHLNGRPDRQYCWRVLSSTAARDGIVEPDGLAGGNVSGEDFSYNLHAVYDALIRSYNDQAFRDKFDPDTACAAIHEYIEKL